MCSPALKIQSATTLRDFDPAPGRVAHNARSLPHRSVSKDKVASFVDKAVEILLSVDVASICKYASFLFFLSWLLRGFTLYL